MLSYSSPLKITCVYCQTSFFSFCLKIKPTHTEILTWTHITIRVSLKHLSIGIHIEQSNKVVKGQDTRWGFANLLYNLYIKHFVLSNVYMNDLNSCLWLWYCKKLHFVCPSFTPGKGKTLADFTGNSKWSFLLIWASKALTCRRNNVVKLQGSPLTYITHMHYGTVYTFKKNKIEDLFI